MPISDIVIVVIVTLLAIYILPAVALIIFGIIEALFPLVRDFLILFGFLFIAEVIYNCWSETLEIATVIGALYAGYLIIPWLIYLLARMIGLPLDDKKFNDVNPINKAGRQIIKFGKSVQSLFKPTKGLRSNR